VPVGGEGMLDAAAAYKLAVSLEPSIIIPMHYTGDSLKKFLKEAGEDVAAIDKLVVKKKDLEAREGDIVILSQE
jgi:L-ascorbate metabolism protein UlaG (beta-lactamase superfamily)